MRAASKALRASEPRDGLPRPSPDPLLVSTGPLAGARPNVCPHYFVCVGGDVYDHSFTLTLVCASVTALVVWPLR